MSLSYDETTGSLIRISGCLILVYLTNYEGYAIAEEDRILRSVAVTEPGE